MDVAREAREGEEGRATRREGESILGSRWGSNFLSGAKGFAVGVAGKLRGGDSGGDLSLPVACRGRTRQFTTGCRGGRFVALYLRFRVAPIGNSKKRLHFSSLGNFAENSFIRVVLLRVQSGCPGSAVAFDAVSCVCRVTVFE